MLALLASRSWTGSLIAVGAVVGLDPQKGLPVPLLVGGLLPARARGGRRAKVARAEEREDMKLLHGQRKDLEDARHLPRLRRLPLCGLSRGCSPPPRRDATSELTTAVVEALHEPAAELVDLGKGEGEGEGFECEGFDGMRVWRG